MCARHICNSLTLIFLVIDALQINQHAPKPFHNQSESAVMEHQKVFSVLVLLLCEAHNPDRPPLDSHLLPTDYETGALANTPPGIVYD